jgi:hypothetical protein
MKIVVPDQIAFFLPAKIVKTTKTQLSLPCFSSLQQIKSKRKLADVNINKRY